MFYCIHSKAIQFQFIHYPFSPAYYFLSDFRMGIVHICIHKIVIISHFPIHFFSPVLVFSYYFINSRFLIFIIKIYSCKKIIVPFKSRISVVSSRKCKFCPSFNFIRFCHFFISVVRSYFYRHKSLCFICSGLMIQYNIKINIYTVFMKFINCFYKFLFCPIFRSYGTLLIKFS